jgi:uncharacterized membrane protein YgcG
MFFSRKKTMPLTEDEIASLQLQIAEAETLSSAEFRIILARPGWLGIRHKARQLFRKYGMDRKARHNAVLIAVDYVNNDMVLLGDSAAESKMGSEFWFELESMLDDALKAESLFEALSSCIHILGCRLPIYFPPDPEVAGELANEILLED